MELTIKEAEERAQDSQKNRSKVRKNLVKKSLEYDYDSCKFTPLYRWQTVYLKADYELTLTEVIVYSHIYGLPYDCYETIEHISENTACSVRSVGTAINNLIKKGLIFAETECVEIDNGVPRMQRVLSINRSISGRYD